jgi:hypothetical protein
VVPIGYNARLVNSKRLRQFGIGLVFAATIFLGAFLLFQVQPLIGRFLLPWFGGSPEVWTTCMLFFQMFLLAGYAYAHLLIRISPSKLQAVIHLGLLAAALVFLPIFPEGSSKPVAEGHPVIQILRICSLTVGVPYLLLSATSPLVQAWYSRTHPSRNPYRLYALSNAGSLLALVSFPLVFEPLLSRVQTAHLWSVVFAVFAVLCAATAWIGGSHKGPTRSTADKHAEETSPNRAASVWWLWIALPAAASVELLAVTNKITQDIAVIPFLWVLPLGLYLLSFIICFEHQRWYKRWLFVPLFMIGISGVIAARIHESQMGAYQIIGVYCFVLFTCCMVCHGELYRLRPHTKHLTGYYLTIAAGGALGGFYVAVICPLIFNVYIELYQGLLLCACFLLLVDSDIPRAQRKRRPYWITAIIVIGFLGISFMGELNVENQRAIDNRRNFFGVLTIWEESPEDPVDHKRLMQHGTTFHGLQFQLPEKEHLKTAYYAPSSGVGMTLLKMPRQDSRRIGIVGLGVGTIAGYGKPTDTFRFYEINPQVEQLARQYFSYLEDCEAKVEVLLGDARLSMENEPPQAYDVLVLDAFSSDVVPVHLLTAEAMDIYLKHLAHDGVLAFHISTQHLDLHSVVWKLAEHFDLETAWIESYEDDSEGVLASDWILMARVGAFLGSEAIQKEASSPSGRRKEVMLWTDDHINLLEILKKSPLS